MRCCQLSADSVLEEFQGLSTEIGVYTAAADYGAPAKEERDRCGRIHFVSDGLQAALVLPGGATAGDDRKMNNEPLEREPIERVRARLEALLKANAAPRCRARSKRTGKPCQGAAMPNGRCKLHGGKSTGPRTPEGTTPEHHRGLSTGSCGRSLDQSPRLGMPIMKG